LRINNWASEPDDLLRGIKVLVVDDNVAVRQTLVDTLTIFGATVIAEESADMALTVLARERPHVLLSDIAMPGHDGLWLIRQVRALPAARGGDTPAAALTGHVLAEDRAVVLAAGFQCHLQKPVRIDDLLKTVRFLAARP
jgi:CheY-like chemotaxis protein